MYETINDKNLEESQKIFTVDWQDYQKDLYDWKYIKWRSDHDNLVCIAL